DSPSPTIVAENRSEPFDVLPLPSASTSSLQFVSNAGVRGTKAGRFNNHQYAKSQNAIDLKGDFSASAWVSTEDFESSLEPRMPILSNLSADCASGVRLELRVCDDDPTTIVAAMGRPAGKQNDGQCKLDFEYAPLTQRSFVGGYFTPWHSGNWYHLMATSEGGVARLYVDGARADLSRVARECPSVIRNTRNVQSSDDSQLYIGWHADGLSKSADMEPPVSRSILIDEVMLFQQALSEVEITRLELASKSEPGPSGLRWGPWGTQGGFVTRAPEASGLTYTVHDEEFSSAGVFAVLGQPKDILNVTGPAKLPDLSDFDEAVLVTTGWSPNVPFQFALSSDHGLRQCTWQLEGHEPISTRPASGSLEPQRDMFVINLRRPSWCISPDLVLDTRRIELVSIGSDWKLPHSSYNFDVDALAFRKRHFASSTDDPAPVLGGVIGPNGWYWKAVSYDPGWEPQPPKQLAKVDGNTPVTMPKALYSGTEAPELAADLPDNQGSRDFSGCKTMQICMTANDPAPPFREPMFVMQNEIGQTWSVQLSPSSGCPLIAELDRGYAWPSKNPPSLNDVRSAVTRISIRYSGNAQVDYVKCCDADGLCVDIEKLPVH
ncbi:MAG TPA: LamG-like jellyroll fold domain-containing protein, partial [Polyangiaceae bacterium]